MCGFLRDPVALLSWRLAVGGWRLAVVVEGVSVAHICHRYFTGQRGSTDHVFDFCWTRFTPAESDRRWGDKVVYKGGKSEVLEPALRWLAALVSCVVGSAAVIELKPSKQQGTSPGNNTWKQKTAECFTMGWNQTRETRYLTDGVGNFTIYLFIYFSFRCQCPSGHDKGHLACSC